MVGDYHMVLPSSGESFDVRIPAFSLDYFTGTGEEAVAGTILSEQGELMWVVTILHDLTEAIEKARLFEQLKMTAGELDRKVQEATAELAEQLRERKRERSLETPQAPTVVRASARFLRSASRVSPAPREGLLLTDHEFPPGVLSDTFGSTYCWRIMVTAIVIEIRSLSPHRLLISCW